MRKKIFAIVMSTMMMVGFMPSMAFAAVNSHSYAVDGATKDGDTVAWTAVQTALAGDHATSVKVTKEATCAVEDKDAVTGSAEVTCYDSNCTDEVAGHTITVKVTKAHDDATVTDLTAQEIADKLVAQDICNEKQATDWVKDEAKKADTANETCYYTVKACKNCGKLATVTDVSGNIGKYVIANQHEQAASATDCSGKAYCKNCGKFVKFASEKAHTWTIATSTDTDNNIVITAGKHVATVTSAADPDLASLTNYVMTNWVNTKADFDQYFKVVDKATCGHNATIARYCTVCGETDSAVPASAKAVTLDSTLGATGHKFNTVEPATAGCANNKTIEGLKNGYVAVLVTDTDTQATNDTKYVFIKCDVLHFATDADCQYVVKCTECGEYYETPATMSVPYVVTATNVDWTTFCKVVGTTEHTNNATKFGTVAQTEIAHNWVVKEHAATCTKKAYSERTCSICDKKQYSVDGTNWYDSTSVLNLDQEDHNYVATLVEKTCTDPAHYAIKCTKCDNSETVYSTAWTGMATSTKLYLHPATGAVDTLNTAGAQELSYVAPSYAGHILGKVETYKAATCKEDGIEGQKCTVCGKWIVSTFNSIDKTNKHDYVATEVAATCENNAYTKYECSVCKTTYYVYEGNNYETLPSAVWTGKRCTYTKWTTEVEPTIFEEGTAKLVCSVCGHAEGETDAIDVLAYAKPIVKTAAKKATVKVTAQAGAVSYKVMYKRYGAKYAWKSVKATAGSKTIKKLAAKKYYYFKVVATDADGCSVTSATTMAKVK